MQPLQEKPGESAEVEEMQQDGDASAQELQREQETDENIKTRLAGNIINSTTDGKRKLIDYRVVCLVDAQDEDEL